MSNLLQHTRRPDISFSRNGAIRIRARVARMLDLRPGDSVNIDHVGPEYYLHKAETADSFGGYHARCHPTKQGSRNFIAYSFQLVAALFDSVGLDADEASFFVGRPCECAGIVCVPIITRRPL